MQRRLFILIAAFAILATHPYANAQAAAKMEEHVHTPAAPSTTLSLTVAGSTTNYTVADLKALPQKSVTVHNAHLNADETYTGVLVSDLLAKVGVTAEKLGNKTIYHSYLKAEGTDMYWVLYSATEIEPAMHKSTAIIALTVDGKPLGEDGLFKFVSSDDTHPARWVRNLKSLTFTTTE